MLHMDIQSGVNAGEQRAFPSTASAAEKVTVGHLLPLLLIGVGILLRLNQYLFNRSLWLDEAFIATNFLHKTWAELLQTPMEYTSTMTIPLGFIVAARLSTILFGNRDIVLRLYPFLSSILSLPLFYKLARSYASRSAAIVALFLFSTSWPLIYQASEFKPYSSDVACAIVILLFVPMLARRTLTSKRLIVLAMAGALVVWFSFPAAFLLAAIGSFLAIGQAKQKQWNTVGAMAAVSIVWLISFALQYKVAMGTRGEASSNGQWLIEFWQRRDAFMPFPFSTTIVSWSLLSFTHIFLDPSGWLGGVLPIALFFYLVGFIFMMVRNRGTLFLMTMPIVFTSVASYFRVYPFYGRMLFFLLPSIFLVVGEGIAQLSLVLTPGGFKNRASLVILSQIILAILLVNYVPHYATREELKPVLKYVQSQMEEQDKIYLFFTAEPAFRYYSSSYGLNYENCNIIVPIPQKEFVEEIDYFRSKQNLKPTAVDETQCILGVSAIFDESSRSELAKLKGAGRMWFVFSHSSSSGELEFLEYLDSVGTRLDEIIEYGASAYLYDLSSP